jgi:YbbR domain-containing protein
MDTKFPNPFRFLWDNRDTFFLAFLLGVAVWASAVIASDPNQDDPVPNGVPLLVVGKDDSLILRTTVEDKVEVHIRAPESLWQEMITNPDLVQAKLDLSGLESGTHTLPVVVTLGVSPAQILDVSPASFQVTLEEMISVEMQAEINLIGEPALGFKADDYTLEPDTVTVTGPESKVKLVEKVVGNLSVNNARVDISTSTNLAAVDDQGYQISEITIDPTQVNVDIPVIQSSGYRDIAVQVETTGQPEIGYLVTNISVDPPTITVFSSNPEKVAEMPGVVSIGPVDLTGRTEGVNESLEPILPEGVVMVGDVLSVQVQIGITAIETSILLNVPVQVLEIGTGLAADLSPTSVNVLLTGPLPVVENLTPDDLIVFISLSGLDVGTYLVEPKSNVLIESVVMESINPDTIEVIIATIDNGEDAGDEETLTPTPTPTPTPAP